MCFSCMCSLCFVGSSYSYLVHFALDRLAVLTVVTGWQVEPFSHCVPFYMVGRHLSLCYFCGSCLVESDCSLLGCLLCSSLAIRNALVS